MLLHSLVVKGWQDFLLCSVLFHEVDKLLKQIIAGRSCCVARYVIKLTGYYTIATNLRWSGDFKTSERALGLPHWLFVLGYYSLQQVL